MKYRDKVVVTTGFYEGTKGIVLDVYENQFLVRLDGPSPYLTEYLDKWLMADTLALQETNE
jgi:hypothetical protein